MQNLYIPHAHSIYTDPYISVVIQWPTGQFSLIEAASGCPSGMSSGWRYQDNEDVSNGNHWRPSDINSCIRIGLGENFKTHYCTKTSDQGDFSWPRGKYCIARHGGICPSGFYGGSIYWDDQNDDNNNDVQNPIPDGKFNNDTKIEFCCRSDGNHNDPILLPPTQPFALYRYDGRCQKVLGMNDPIALYMHFDDEDTSNDDRCYGNRPDGPCNDRHNHDLYLCYYGPNITRDGQNPPCADYWHITAQLTVKVRYARNLDHMHCGPMVEQPRSIRCCGGLGLR